MNIELKYNKKYVSIWRRILLKLSVSLMPDFYKMIPEYKEGKYSAFAGTYITYKRYRYIKSDLPDSHTAYVIARLEALRIDTSYSNSYAGVFWEIELQKEEYEKT